MKTFFIAYGTAMLSMLVIDLVWLSVMMKPFYQKYIGHLLSETPSLLPAAIFYLIFILGLIVFVVLPAYNADTSYLKLFFYGALFGLVAYGTYDFTNQATMKNWPTIVTMVDIVWGSVLTGIVAIITKYFLSLFK